MKCSKCGNENNELSLFCSECGTKLRNADKQQGQARTNKKMLVGVLAALTVIVIGVLVVFMFKPTKPDIEQLKKDLISEEIDEEKYTISNITIDSETDGKDEQYKAIVTVVYDDENVEYTEKYHFTYNRYDDWLLDSVEDYDEDSWTKKPLTIPSIDEYKTKCSSVLYDDGEYTEYDSFEAVSSKTQEDLEEGKVTFVFEVKDEAVIQSVSGEIEFEVQFDDERGKWIVEDFAYMDSYAVEHNLIHTWNGKGSHMGEHGTKIVEENFTLKIKEYYGGEANAVLTYQNKEYVLSGSVSLPEGAGGHISIDLANISDKMRVEGFMTIDGELYVTVDTAYVPDARFYYPVDRYDVDLFVE